MGDEGDGVEEILGEAELIEQGDADQPADEYEGQDGDHETIEELWDEEYQEEEEEEAQEGQGEGEADESGNPDTNGHAASESKPQQQAAGPGKRVMPAAYYMNAADMEQQHDPAAEPQQQQPGTSGQGNSQQRFGRGDGSSRQDRPYDRQGRSGGGGQGWGAERGQGRFGRGDRGRFGDWSDRRGGRVQFARGRGGRFGAGIDSGSMGGQPLGPGPMGAVLPAGMMGMPGMEANQAMQQMMLAAAMQGMAHSIRPHVPPVPPPRPPPGNPPPSTSGTSVPTTTTQPASNPPAAGLGMPSILRPGRPARDGPVSTTPPNMPQQGIGVQTPPLPVLPPVPVHPMVMLPISQSVPGAEAWRGPGGPLAPNAAEQGMWGGPHGGPGMPRGGMPPVLSPRAGGPDVGLGMMGPGAMMGPAWHGMPAAGGPFAAPVAPRSNKWVRPGATPVPAAEVTTETAEGKTAPLSAEADLQRRLAIIEQNKKEQEKRRKAAAAAAAAAAAGGDGGDAQASVAPTDDDTGGAGAPTLAATTSGAASTATASVSTNSVAAATAKELLQAQEEYIEKLRRMIALQEAAVKQKSGSLARASSGDGNGTGTGSGTGTGTGSQQQGPHGTKRSASRSASPPCNSVSTTNNTAAMGTSSAPVVKKVRRVVQPAAKPVGGTVDGAGGVSGAEFCEEGEAGDTGLSNGHTPVDDPQPALDLLLGGAPAMEDAEL